MRCCRVAWIVVVLGSGCSGSPVAPSLDARRDLGPDSAVRDVAAADLAGAERVPRRDLARDSTRVDGPRKDAAQGDRPRPDLLPADQVKLPDGLSSALQAVVNTITLPKTAQEYAHVYDSSGVAKNKLGAIINVLAQAGLGGFDFQTGINAQLASGSFLLLLDVRAKSITADPAAFVRAALGKDLDVPPMAADNFSGSEPLGVQPTSPNMVLAGAIAAGKLTAQGSLMLLMPIGATPVLVTLNKAELLADLSAAPLSAMTNGRIYGLIPWTDVDQKLIPAMATLMDQLYKDPTTPASTVAMLRVLFDSNSDGTISASEVRQSALLKLVLAPDVDTNGDGQADAMSVGVAFTAVKCIIQ